MSDACYDLEGVARHFGGWSLGPLSLSLSNRRVTALIGASGSGKSTLLRLLAGFMAPDAGSIRYHGDHLEALAPGDYLARLGYMMQGAGLFPHLSARDNVLLAARHGSPAARLSVDEQENRIGELADLVQLEPAQLARFPHHLSGGQRQRVALMRALMLKPDVLFLDEPLSALDPLVRYELQSELKRIFDRLGMTVILVTHDMAEAAYLADDLILLHDGAIEQRGSLRDFIDRPASGYVEHFLTAQRVFEGAS